MSQEIKICSSDSGCFLGGLSATDTIASNNKIQGACIVKTGGTSSQFLKADGSSDSNAYTTCTGDVTGIDAGTAITVSDGSTATPQVAVTTACNTAWNSAKTIADGLASCAGLACVGDVTGIDAGDGITVNDGSTATPEVTVDSTVVRTTGDQSIAGVKTFTDQVKVATCISHNGDDDTHIKFTPDCIRLTTGSDSQVTITNSEVVINDPGNNNDFRVESNNDTHALFVDGSADNVGIGTSTPTARLTLSGAEDAEPLLFIGNKSQAGGAGIEFTDTGNESQLGGIVYRHADSQSQGGGASFSLSSTEYDLALIVGAGAFTGRVVVKSAGSADEVQYGFYDDINTGVYRPANHMVGLVANGSERIRVEETGSCAIGNFNTTGEILSSGTDIAEIFTKCIGCVTGIGAGTAITITDGATATPDIGVTTACNTAWNSAKSIADGLAGCAGLACVGDITGVTAGSGLEGGGNSGSVTLNVGAGALIDVDADVINVDLGELADMTGGIVPAVDEIVLLDNGAQRRKVFSEIFGCNAYSSDSFTTCTGTTTPSNSQTFTNKSGNISQWTNDSGYTTCTGDITNVSVGTGLDGGGASGDVSITLDLSELTDMTGAIDPAVDEIILLDAGAEKRKPFSEIFGSNAYNSTTIPTNNNQLTNGAGFTTCTGDVTGIDAGTAITVTDGTTATPQVAVTAACNTAWNSAKSLADGLAGCPGLGCTGDITGVTAGLLLSGGGNSGSVTLGLDSGALAGLDQSACPGILCTGTVVDSDLDDVNALIGCPGLDCVGDVTGIDAGTAITVSDGSTATPQVAVTSACNTAWNSAKTIADGLASCAGLACVGDITGVAAGSGLTGGGNSGSVTLNIGAGNLIDVAADTVSVDLSELTDGTAAIVPTSDEVVYLDAGSQKRKLFSEIFGSNAYNSTTIPTNNNQLTNGAGFTTCTGTTTPSNTQTFTNKSGNISQWTNDSGYTTCTGDITNVSVGTGLDGGGASGSVTISLDLSELADGTGAIVPASDEVIYLDGGTQKRKLFSEIFGSNAYNSTTIPTNNNQLTNGAGFTTCTGDVTGIDAGTAITVTDGTTATPQVAVTSACNTAWNSAKSIADGLAGCAGLACTGDITGVTAGLLLSGGGASGSVTLGLDSGALEGYASGFTGGNGIDLDASDMSDVEINVDSTVVRTSGNQLIAGIKCFSSVMCAVGDFCAQSRILSGGVDLFDIFCDESGGGAGDITAVTAGCGLLGGGTTGAVTVCAVLDADFCQKILTNCGSVCLGKCAGKSITEGSGIGNVAIGNCTLCTVSTGDANLGIGKQALQNVSTGSRNVAIGDTAGFRITGSDNLVFGRSSGCGITSGGCNVAIGNYAHRTATNDGTGSNNVAIGSQSLRDNVSGNCNIAIGFCAAQELSTGCKNIAVGPCALGATTGIVTGHCNIAIGEATSWKNTSGSNNIAMGFVALGCNCTGSCNVAIGYTAGRFTGTGTTQMQAPTRSIFIGCDSTGGGGSATNNEIVLGSGAVGCGSNTAMIGNSSVTVVCSNGTFSTVSDLRDKTCICDIEHGLDFIGDLKPKTFNMITDRNDPEGSISCKRHGFIAQEVLELEDGDPVIISTDNPLQLGYTGEHIIPILVKGMQEQQAIINDLKERLEVLEG